MLKRLQNLSPLTKVNIGWAIVVSSGLFAFIAARNNVIGNRRRDLIKKLEAKERAKAQEEKHNTQY